MNFMVSDPAALSLPHYVGLDPDNPASAFDLLLAGQREGVDGALLTIVNIEGGAPRSIGTHMAVLADGRYCGYVSGGCVEAAVASEALEVMARGQDKVLRFGRNSPFFDIKLPCGGGIDVHIHVRPDRQLLETAAANLKARLPFDVVFDAAAGTVRIAAPEIAAEADDFVRRYRPATRLVLVGQGNELAVLASVARAAGIETAAYTTGPGAVAAAARVGTDIVDAASLESPADLGADPWTAVIFLFHDHASEATYLPAALRSEAFYIGALGSRRTHAERTERLKAAGVSQAAIDRIHAPIGLIERTREATPLAFSILADIAQQRMRIEAGAASA